MTRLIRSALPLTIAFTLAACVASKQGIHAPGDPARPVTAAVETVVTTDNAVNADDPELWADARDPSRALLFGTDKSDGLYVHDIDGSVRQFFPDGPLNNVDLRTDFVVDGKSMVLIAASDRAQNGIRTYLLDPASMTTRPYGFIPADIGEPYGFCLGRHGDAMYAVVSNKDGVMLQVRIEADAGAPRGTVVRRLKVSSQPEGCVVDDETHQLYVGEEDVGVWRFDFDPQGSSDATEVAHADGHRLTADVEGLAILRDGDRKYLIVSSQGDSTYPVYRIEGTRYVYLGRFAIVDGERIDGVTSTDGVSAWSGPIGFFPEGAIAVHDDQHALQRGQQNYKIVDWREVKKALSIQ